MTTQGALKGDLELVLPRAADALRALDGSTVLMTGATGFVGLWLLRLLMFGCARMRLNIHAVVVSRNIADFAAKHPDVARSVRLIQSDIRELGEVPGRVDAVIHAAAETNTSLRNPTAWEYHDVAMRGAIAVANNIRRCRARRVLCVSSGAAYAAEELRLGRVTEEAAGAPLTTDSSAAYANAKRACEAALTSLGGEDTAVIVARLFAFIGPYLPLRSGFAVGNFLFDALNGNPIRIEGDGTPIRSYMHGADLAAWLWQLLAFGRNGRIYNVGSEEEVSIAQLAERIMARVGGGPIDIAGRAATGARANRYVPSTRRICEELGAAQMIGLDQAIIRTAQWWRQQVIKDIVTS